MCNCLIFICHTLAVSFSNTWDYKNIDDILQYGSFLYKSLSTTHDYLLVEDLPQIVNHIGFTFQWDISETFITCASTRTHFDIHNCEHLSIEDVLRRAAQTGNEIFCTLGNKPDSRITTDAAYTTACIKHGTSWILFDPHSRNKHGLLDNLGKAVILQFRNIDDVATHFRKLSASLKLDQDFYMEVDSTTFRRTSSTQTAQNTRYAYQ